METSLSINYLIQEPKIKKDKNPLILLLHGYGSNEEDLFSFASELPEEYYIVSAQAPYPVPPYGYAWYAIHFDADANKFSDDQQAIESRELIVKFIDELVQTYPIDATNINLVGFSQGAILSYAIALSYPEKINKVVALSGYFNANIIKAGFEQNDFSQLQLFASHGTVDQVIPVDWARKTSPILDALQIKHQYKEYPVGHGVHPLNFTDFKNFLIG
ncbi:alpha/beta hydrolase [Myroides sp. 1354]|uniref:alpha/beta hydrolase n=1 Tax=unclassified Myroides TaxID=2642485 RepID=UPI002577762D|nr:MULTISPECIES: alpha/beta fold hydrolase [unclassified Myroides]MDM1044415.1 alpha/beta hydrolase [Myroides sp. R163-1]MDM1056290.1 alpha/beta hydrolase [Myroides sp. 1354]MDM1069354.1 alpha/beta hydrolase [Myroides sp. 1372]